MMDAPGGGGRNGCSGGGQGPKPPKGGGEHADATHRDHFAEAHRDLLERVAAQVATPICERISIIDAVKEVGVELTRLPSEGGVERTLQKIADLAVRSLGADAVTVYQYVHDRDEFPVEGTGPTISGAIGDKLPMQRKVHPGDVPWTMVKERRSGFYGNVQEQDFLTREIRRPGEPPRPRFVAREGIRYSRTFLQAAGGDVRRRAFGGPLGHPKQ
jgi:hypothetical protein